MPESNQGGQEKRTQTYKAVGVLRSRAASSTFSMTAVTDVGSIAPAITLFCTHRPCHCRRQIWSLDQSQPPRGTSKGTWSSWEKLGSGISIDPIDIQQTFTEWSLQQVKVTLQKPSKLTHKLVSIFFLVLTNTTVLYENHTIQQERIKLEWGTPAGYGRWRPFPLCTGGSYSGCPQK